MPFPVSRSHRIPCLKPSSSRPDQQRGPCKPLSDLRLHRHSFSGLPPPFSTDPCRHTGPTQTDRTSPYACTESHLQCPFCHVRRHHRFPGSGHGHLQGYSPAHHSPAPLKDTLSSNSLSEAPSFPVGCLQSRCEQTWCFSEGLSGSLSAPLRCPRQWAVGLGLECAEDWFVQLPSERRLAAEEGRRRSPLRPLAYTALCNKSSLSPHWAAGPEGPVVGRQPHRHAPALTEPTDSCR